MSDTSDLDLTFPMLPYGTHQVPWDLRVLLYRGGAGVLRTEFESRHAIRQFGEPLSERIPMVYRLHEVLTSKIIRGLAYKTIINNLEALWRFVDWVDTAYMPLTVECGAETFRNWAEAMLHRIRVLKNITARTASSEARQIADLLAKAMRFTGDNPGPALIRTTCLRPTGQKKRVLGTQADKQKLEETFAFGHFLCDICDGMDVQSVHGKLPLRIKLRDGVDVIVAGGLRNVELDVITIRHSIDRENAIQARAALAAGESPVNNRRRSRLLNLRIEAELLVFVAQTGMNLTQAAVLRRENYRWQTDGEDVHAYRVYKGRRGGDAVFRCFRSYRDFFKRYLIWLDEVGLAESDDRLFPFVYLNRIPGTHEMRDFAGIRAVSEKVGRKFIGPRALRRTRLNWLLRRSKDPDLTADQAAHSRQTLLRIYEEPHHQSAAAEVTRFHRANDPTVESPGPGFCTSEKNGPIPIKDMPSEAPNPDCVSPDGCLFCVFHRDVLSAEYCWKLASHLKIKALELSLYKPPTYKPNHPAKHVLDRINEKLVAIANGSEVRALWVRDAQDNVRAGRNHPEWNVYIELFEALS